MTGIVKKNSRIVTIGNSGDLIFDDLENIVAFLKERHVKIEGAELEWIVNRAKTLLADAKLKTAVDEFGKFTDKEGKIATSKGGFVIQINKRIIKHIGAPVESMDKVQLSFRATSLDSIARYLVYQIDKGEKTRAEIKSSCYEIIVHYGNLYQQEVKGLGDIWNR